MSTVESQFELLVAYLDVNSSYREFVVSAMGALTSGDSD